MSTELELFDKIKQDDKIAFESLFRTYYTSLCLFSNKIVKDAVVAEEIVQDLFYHFWEKRHTLELQTSIKSYLFRSVYNNSLKHIRHLKIVHEHENYIFTTGNQTQPPDNYAELGEMIHIINDTLKQVPERTRKIFELNRYEGLKYAEIAEQLGISVKTVEAHITGLLKTLRINLKDYILTLFIFVLYLIG